MNERYRLTTQGEIYLERLRSYLERFAGRAAEVTPRNWVERGVLDGQSALVFDYWVPTATGKSFIGYRGLQQ